MSASAGTPFLIGPPEIAALDKLRRLATSRPIDMLKVMERIKTRAGKAAHMRRMTRQSVALPFGYLVTFSIELNHPVGTCRHMSMSSPMAGRIPIPAAVWMVAEALGFVGGLETCTVWPEELQGHQGVAINVVQPLAVEAEGGRA